MSESIAPYQGLKVLDLSARLSGAFAAQLFGDYGADVVLAEPAAGHTLRHEPPFALEGGASPVHAYANWNKRSRVFAELSELESDIREADVVVTTAVAAARQIEPWLDSQPGFDSLMACSPLSLWNPLARRNLFQNGWL